MMAKSGKLLGALIILGAAHVPAHGDEVLPKPAAPFAGRIGAFGMQSQPAWPQPPHAPAKAPNVVLILLDDVGFGVSDAFGGPVPTPALDRLAADGVRYNQFHTTAMCSPTRAALLTGRNHHQVGFGSLTDSAAGFPGYTAIWNPATASVAEILRQNGYSTAAFGKWHNTPESEVSPVGPFDRWPTGVGFEYFYGFNFAESSQWEPRLYRNTSPVEPAQPGRHLTAELADDAIHWMHQHESVAPQKPFFLYFATGAVHAPHHVGPEWIERFRGRFDQGWDKVREQTFARQKKQGVIPANTQLTPRPQGLPAWDSLTSEQKRVLARQMEVYAAFMAQTDFEIGRLLDDLQRTGQARNTMVLYVVGDNGGSAEGSFEGSIRDFGRAYGARSDMPEMLQRIDELGQVELDNHYAAGWAWATGAPFQWMKQIASHFGGTRNGMVLSWPERIAKGGGIRNQFSHVNDVVPTILEAAGIAMPSSVNGTAQLPLEGTSLLYTFDQPQAPTRHTVQYFELYGNRGIYKDGWFAGARHALPWELFTNPMKIFLTDPAQDQWELYNVAADFSQARDLAAQQPEKLAEMKALFDSEAKRNQVYPLVPIPMVGKPAPDAETKQFTYFEGAERLPRGVLPNLERSHRIAAELDVPAGGANGVVVARGGRYGGWSLFVKDGKLTYESNTFDETRETLVAPEALPTGKIQVAFEFEADPRPNMTPIEAMRNPVRSGRGRLFVNGTQVSEARIERLGGFAGAGITETFDLAKDSGSPVSNAYAAPFAFNGRVEKVVIDLL
jgi:arylsulfatase